MPNKALRPCNHPGCHELVQSGYCDKHKKDSRQYDKCRGNANERGYTRQWQELRRAFLLSYPLCHDCFNLVPQRVTQANEVHHIKAKRNGGTDSWDNLMQLCHTCHSKRTFKGE